MPTGDNQKKGKDNPNFIDHTGEIHTNNQGDDFEIIECFSRRNCTIKFLDFDNVILRNINYGNILLGSVKNPYHRSVCGVGYLGVGKYKKHVGRKPTLLYVRWSNMIKRCYSGKVLFESPSYIKCTVMEEWHNFQVFAEWFEHNWKSYMNGGWELDKDILVKGNKIYSPDTCCFVPQIINTILLKCDKVRGDLPIGVIKAGKYFIAQLSRPGHTKYKKTHKTAEEAFYVYKFHKEAYIKEVADEWRPLIGEKVYFSLINYQVEITD